MAQYSEVVDGNGLGRLSMVLLERVFRQRQTLMKNRSGDSREIGMVIDSLWSLRNCD